MNLNRVRTFSNLCMALSLCLFVVLCATVNAEVFNGQAGSSDYTDPNNWENNVLPGSGGGGQQARIGQVGTGGDGVPFQNPAVVTLSDPNFSTAGLPSDLRIGQGNNGDGTLNHSAGNITTAPGAWSFAGVDGDGANPSIGRYNMSGTASFNSDSPFYLGLGGGGHPDPNMVNEGYLTIADTAAMDVGAMNVGGNDGNYGQLDQSSGTLNVQNWFNIGDDSGSTGLYNMTGGALTGATEMSVGQKNGATGTFDVSGTASVDVGNLRVGREDSAPQGFLNITGGLVNFESDQLTVGGNDGAFNSAMGTLSFTSDLTGLSPIQVLGNPDPNGTPFTVNLNDGSVSGFADLVVDLSANLLSGAVVLIDNQTGNPVNGTFQGLPEGAAVPGSGGRTITYTYQGNSVALVPEPATGVLLLCALGAGLLTRKRTICA